MPGVPSTGCPTSGTSQPMSPRVFSSRAASPLAEVQTMTTSAPLARAFVISSVRSVLFGSTRTVKLASAPAALAISAARLVLAVP